MRRTRGSEATLALLGLGLALYVLASGLMEQCTTDALCTLERCPDRCSRPEQILVVTGSTLLVLSPCSCSAPGSAGARTCRSRWRTPSSAGR